MWLVFDCFFLPSPWFLYPFYASTIRVLCTETDCDLYKQTNNFLTEILYSLLILILYGAYHTKNIVRFVGKLSTMCNLIGCIQLPLLHRYVYLNLLDDIFFRLLFNPDS